MPDIPLSGRHLGWLGFFGLILLAWAALFLMSAPQPDPALIRLYGADFWAALCAVGVADAGFSGLWAMWAIMAAAMMAPTLVPALRTYEDMTHAGAADTRGFLALVAGYLLIWLGFAAFAAVAQMLLSNAGMLDSTGASLAPWLSAALLLAAGAYQFSALKEACLSKCRAPVSFFLAHWSPGPGAALGMGLRLGAICLGCCWALMLLGFVGGVMSLAWMGLATVLMVLEKLPDIGRLVTRPLGIVLLLAAGGMALRGMQIV